MTIPPKCRPPFVPEDIWEQCHETICVCYRHRWWGLACWCPDCRPAKQPIPLTPLPEDPYAGGADPMRCDLATLPDVYAEAREIGHPYDGDGGA